jgi:metal-dependent amidase/aminoacylase/carboxypeptidase family protein
LAAAVLSVTRIHGGTTENVIPDRVTLGGTVRSFTESVQNGIEEGMRRMAEGIAAAHGVGIELDYQRRYRSTVNDPGPVAVALAAMDEVMGPERVIRDLPPTMGAEDFGWMLAVCPGAYAMLGNGVDGAHGRALHNPGYDFNDSVIGVGVRYWVELVRQALPLTAP